MSKKISCPAYSYDCSYWKDGFCTMYEQGDGHPKDDCDDYYAYTGDEEG